jgi:hypothetical protein
MSSKALFVHFPTIPIGEPVEIRGQRFVVVATTKRGLALRRAKANHAAVATFPGQSIPLCPGEPTGCATCANIEIASLPSRIGLQPVGESLGAGDSPTRDVGLTAPVFFLVYES